MRMSSVQLRPSFAHHTDHACINDARHRSTEAGRQQTKEEDVATQKKRNAKETRGDDAAWYRLHGSSMPAGGEEMRFDSARGLQRAGGVKNAMDHESRGLDTLHVETFRS
ncbi:hypothetical protein [Burkholderia cepacia]|uniref:hypothetical protein n=1 Tax=Burkholderia cepacia TaxID=292 RepID=UPI0012D91DA0|nr:hypothetical protein [Burkholderia cepacia]